MVNVMPILMLGLVLVGLFDILSNYETNRCEMTWMYEYPEYLPVPLSENVTRSFPRYGLYLYGEGAYARQSKNFKLTGVPVLFIPGNAGSHKQVRSLGSVALKKAQHLRTPFHFNYFSVDLNEELTGMFGAILSEQTEFVHRCILKVLTMYKKVDSPPKSVILVGHSVGGIVARALFTLPDFDPSMVNTIITQATPHQSPVINADQYMADFYNTVNQFWQDGMGSGRLSHVTIASTGGAHRDYLVRAGLTSLKGIVPESNAVSAVTSAIPKVWLSTDHLAIVWCKQLVLATKRSLFDIIDPKTRQVTTDVKHRMQVFRHHFLHHPGSKSFSLTSVQSAIPPGDKWVEVTDEVWEFSETRTEDVTNYMFPIDKELGGRDTFVATTNIVEDSWVYLCQEEGGKRCKEGLDMSSRGQLSPPLYSGHKVVHLHLDSYRSFSHVVVSVPKSSKPVTVQTQFYNGTEKSQELQVPNVMSFAIRSVVEVEVPNNTVFYNISLIGLQEVYHAFTANLVSDCEDNDMTKMHMHIPWFKEDVYSVSQGSGSGKLSLRLQSGKLVDENTNAELRLYLNPKCNYKVQVWVNFAEVLGQLIRFHGIVIPALAVTNILMVLSYQVRTLGRGQPCPSFSEAQTAFCQPYRVAPLVNLFSLLLSYQGARLMYLSLGIPLPDSEVIKAQGSWFRLLPILFYLFASAICRMVSAALFGGVTMIGHCMVWFGKKTADPEEMARKAPHPAALFVISGAFLAVASQFSGALAFALVLALYFGKTCRLYANTITLRNCLNLQNDKKKPGPLADAEDTFHLQYTILYLIWFMSMLYMPSVVFWGKNLNFEYRLPADPALYTAAAMSACFAFLYPLQGCYLRKKRSVVWLSWLVYVSAILACMYSMVALYRTPYFILLAFVVVAFCQRMA
ncbi:GPI inositol-deacylase-like [Branchiostoma floridae]|uniref:GPI inositol-deacylase n=1 Tax=Branchiostoma floridae TaxID=7739 RepID=A0A9J7LE06_BRAFL|nr:GPI inositol-deacylase-like [Branchiostoma floridae]